MKCRYLIIAFLTCCLLPACSAPAPTWRSRASTLVTELGRHDTARLFPQQYRNLVETFEHGEAVLVVQKDDKEADSYYLLALQKGELLQADLKRFREHKAEEERIRAAEKKALAEEERLLNEAAKAEQRLRAKESSRKLVQESKAGVATGSIQVKEQLTAAPTAYTVRRGETLPQIAARNEIYNDASLWPIIYRANRDQIRDPKQLWPGQPLKIPRHFSRDEANEAKRYSGKK